MAQKYRKKNPQPVEAMQWTGDNLQEIKGWTGEDLFEQSGDEFFLYVAANKAWLTIQVNEWILKDKLGFYPCADSVFQESYELNEPHEEALRQFMPVDWNPDIEESIKYFELMKEAWDADLAVQVERGRVEPE